MVTAIPSLNSFRGWSRSPAVRRALKSFSQNYPIASKMLVREELIKNAILTRFMVGLARVHINFPRNEKKIELTRAQKFQSFLERIFIEIINIPLQVATMFFTQEFMARTLQSSRFCAPPGTKQLAHIAERYLGETYTPGQLKAVAKAMSAEFKNRKGLIAEKIYEGEKFSKRMYSIRNRVLQNIVNSAEGTVSSASTTNLAKLNRLTDAAISKYFSRVRGASALSLASGMLTGAIISGYVLQTVNDKYYSTKVVPGILRFFGVLPKQDTNDSVSKINQMPAIQDRTFIM